MSRRFQFSMKALMGIATMAAIASWLATLNFLWLAWMDWRPVVAGIVLAIGCAAVYSAEVVD